MAQLYGRTSDGNNADSGLTWALAKATIAGLSAIDAAGAVVNLSQTFAETSASSSNVWAGTISNPVIVRGANDAAEPPTTASTAPTITISGTTWSWQGNVATFGVKFYFTSPSGWAPAFNDSGNCRQYFQDCAWRLDGANGGQSISFGTSSGYSSSDTEIVDSTFRFSAAGQLINAYRDLTIRGGSWEAGGTTPNGIFGLSLSARPVHVLVEGLDLSNLGTSFNLVQVINEGGSQARFRNIVLPNSWAGNLVASGQMKLGCRVELINGDSADTNYRLWIEDFAGQIKSDTLNVRTGGASDGVTPQSWRMASSANASYPLHPLESQEIQPLNTIVGTPVTYKIEILHDSQGGGAGGKFNDDEIALDAQYLGTSGRPRSLHIDSGPTDTFDTPDLLPDSVETWVTTGLASPIKQSMSVTFTAEEIGFVSLKIKLFKASKVCFVCFRAVKS